MTSYVVILQGLPTGIMLTRTTVYSFMSYVAKLGIAIFTKY